jgi:hypothetical protein
LFPQLVRLDFHNHIRWTNWFKLSRHVLHFKVIIIFFSSRKFTISTQPQPPT